MHPRRTFVNFGDDLLDLVWDQVASPFDDDVLAAARDVDLVIHPIGEITAVEPPARGADLGRLRRLAVVARHRGGSPEQQPSEPPLGQLLPLVVDELDVVTR